MAKNSKPLINKSAPQQAAARNPAQTPKRKIPLVVGVTMPKWVKTMAALCHPTNRHREKMVARMTYGALVKAELDKRSNKKFTKTDSEE